MKKHANSQSGLFSSKLMYVRLTEAEMPNGHQMLWTIQMTWKKKIRIARRKKFPENRAFTLKKKKIHD